MASFIKFLVAIIIKNLIILKGEKMEESFLKFLETEIVKSGFIWGPEPEIYNPVAGFFTYAPLGKLLKNNIEEAIRFELKSNEFYEIEAPNIAPKEVWQASGHIEHFLDKFVICKNCKNSFIFDKLPKESADKMKCPECNSKLESKIEQANLMVKTNIAGREAYCRPETATTTYLQLIRYFDFFRKKMPIKVFQIGKAYRNEISPRQNVIRSREFTQAEAQIFIMPKEKDNFGDYEKIKDINAKFLPAAFAKNGLEEEEMSFEEIYISKYVKSKAYLWCLYFAYNTFLSLGFDRENIRFREHSDNERAHYAVEAWDLEIKTRSFNWLECCGIHDRGNFDLKMHSKHSGKNLALNIGGEEEIPHILEIAFGIDRSLFAILDLNLEFEKENDRIVLRIPRELAPIKVAVFPLVNKDGMDEIALKIYQNLKEIGWDIIYDDSGAIGRRYRRADERGIPVAITVDGQTLKDNTVTIRDRDTMEQKRIKIENLDFGISKFLYENASLNSL